MNLEQLIDEIDDKVAVLKPGDRLCLNGVPDEAYHGALGIGSTRLKAATKSMAHYQCAVEGETDFSPAAVKAMQIGSATHTLVLEPDRYWDRYTTQPAEIKVRNGKKWDEFFAANRGKTILTFGDQILASSMSNAIILGAGKFFKGGEAELSYWYRDPKTKLILKARVDYQKGDAAIDLKTTKHETPEQFRKAVKFEYDMQDALYRHVTGLADMIFIGVSKSIPHSIFLCKQGADVRARAEKIMHDTLAAIAEAEEFDDWPNYPIELTETELTAWEMQEAM